MNEQITVLYFEKMPTCAVNRFNVVNYCAMRLQSGASTQQQEILEMF